MRVHIESNFLECSLVHTHSLFSVLLILPTMLIPLGELTPLKAPKFVLLEPLTSGLKLFFSGQVPYKSLGDKPCLLYESRDEGKLFDLSE